MCVLGGEICEQGYAPLVAACIATYYPTCYLLRGFQSRKNERLARNAPKHALVHLCLVHYDAACACMCRQWKLVEASLAELNWPAAIHGPMVNTRAVCGSWLALRSEVLSLFELRKRVANRMGGGGDLGSSMSGAGPGAAGAGVGGPKTKKLKK